jgi:beta-N-acetylhexosaminidase
MSSSSNVDFDAVLERMSLREKIGQTSQEPFSLLFESEEPIHELLEKYPIGSFFVGGAVINGPERVDADKIREVQQVSQVPLLISGDLESGVGFVVKSRTYFPSPLALAAVNDADLAYRYGKYTALEAKEFGFNWTFSPVVDLSLNWMNPIVANRSFGDNPTRVVGVASEVVRGLQDHGLAACAKHFPGDGVDFRDQHLVTSVNSLSEQEWWEKSGFVFQQMIDHGVDTIMAGHIALPWCEGTVAGEQRVRPATVSKRILTDLLRKRMGFKGVLVSDALMMAGFTGWADRETRLIDAFNAGCDVMLWPGLDYFDLMERGIENGQVSVERLDESVRRVLRLKCKLGLLDDGVFQNLSVPEPKTTRIQAEAVAVAEAVADRSVTLVRNRHQLLPLSAEKTKSLLMHWAVPAHLNEGQLSHLKLLEELIRARGIEVTVIKNGNCLEVQQMEDKGARWDAYLVAYSLLNHQVKNSTRPVGEMGEVMWAQQNTNTLDPITVSLNTPYLLNDLPYLDTLVNAYSVAPASIRALEKVLFGELEFNRNSPVQMSFS